MALFGSAACSGELPLSGAKVDLVNSMIGAECGATACSRNVRPLRRDRRAARIAGETGARNGAAFRHHGRGHSSAVQSGRPCRFDTTKAAQPRAAADRFG